MTISLLIGNRNAVVYGPATIRLMQRDRREGKTFREIAETYGVSTSTARYHTLREPTPPRRVIRFPRMDF